MAVPAAGMSCMGVSTSKQVRDADLIFVGRVIDVEREFLRQELDELADSVDHKEHYGLQRMLNSHYIFLVTEVWKGKVRKFQRVSQAMFSSISANIEKGRTYMVFATRREGFVYTDACMGTMPRAFALDDLSQFGLPKTDPLPGWDMNFSSGQPARSLALNLALTMVAVHLTLAVSRRPSVHRRPRPLS